MWDLFLKKKINESYRKLNFFNFMEEKLPAYCIKGFYMNKYSKKVYTLLSDHTNNNILTPNKYGLRVGHCGITNYFNFLIYGRPEYMNINKVFLLFCEGGTLVYNLHNTSNNVKIAVSNGVFAIVYKQVQNTHLTKVKLPSNTIKLVPSTSDAYLGRNGNLYYKYVVWGSWGFKNKHKGHRPVVRGVAMNPIDHPNGGRSKVKKPFKNKYNKIAKKNK